MLTSKTVHNFTKHFTRDMKEIRFYCPIYHDCYKITLNSIIFSKNLHNIISLIKWEYVADVSL